MRSGVKFILLACCMLPLHAQTPVSETVERLLLASLSTPVTPATTAVPTNAAQLFAENCANCHGNEGRGTKGIPDLANGVWQYGSSSDHVRASISNGRNGLMPGFGIPLGDEALEQVLNYVLSLSNRSDASPQTLQAGAQHFGIYCASCHGDAGTGTATIGAPDLTDNYWLYGGNVNDIRSVIRDGRAANMPAHAGKLTPAKIELLVEYTRGMSRNINLAEAPQPR